MTIGNAITFIERGGKDAALRARLNAASSLSELRNVLADEDLIFSAHDFDEAYHHRLIQCQEMEDAEKLIEFRFWWDLLDRSVRSDQCATACNSCSVHD